VTTVAALGWVAKDQPRPLKLTMSIAVWCFGISAVSGIFTLALVPLIAEQIDGYSSIFTVPVQFLLGSSKPRMMFLTQACRPQHIAFILGIVFYSVAATDLSGPVAIKYAGWIPRLRLLSPALLIALFMFIGWSSHRRPPNAAPWSQTAAPDTLPGGEGDGGRGAK
jgi:hypothetical protein